MHTTVIMLCRLLALVALAAGFVASPALARGQAAQDEFPMPGRLVAVGMVGGQIKPLKMTLRDHALIDENDRWTGRGSHLVVLGEVMTIGNEVHECLSLLHDLSKQAEEAGGMVHLLMTSSTFMALRGELGNIPEANYEGLATPEGAEAASKDLERRLAQLWEFNKEHDEQMRSFLQGRYKDHFERNYLPGAWEFTEAFAPGTELGDWLRSSNTVVKIGDLLFTSSGINATYREMSIREINDYFRDEANREYIWVPIMADPEDPMWWKEWSAYDEREFRETADAMCNRYGAKGVVVGHSPRLGESFQRHRVYHLMSGLTREYNPTIVPASMVIGGEQYQIFMGTRRTPAQAPPAMPTP